MKITLVGSRYFGATAFDAIRREGIAIARVVVPAGDDRLAQSAQAAGVDVAVLDDPRNVPAGGSLARSVVTGVSDAI